MAGTPSRRALLAASAAALPFALAGCRGVQVLGAPPPPARDVRTLRAAIAGERLLISRYQAVLRQAQAESTSYPVTSTLTSLLREHEAHLSRLSAQLVEPAGSASSGVPATPSPEPALPAALPAALTTLAADEQGAADRLASQLLVVPPSLAQLMASISASEATHVPVLHSLRVGR